MSEAATIDTTNIIFSKVFRLDRADDSSTEPLAITWRQATPNTDGTFHVQAFKKKDGQRVEDISQTALDGKTTMNETEMRASIRSFEGGFKAEKYKVVRCVNPHTYKPRLNA